MLAISSPSAYDREPFRVFVTPEALRVPAARVGSGIGLFMRPFSSPSVRELALYEAIQSDEPTWQRQIYDEYVGLVRGLIGKTLGPREDIEDLTADVFVGLFENARNIRSADTMRSYVVSVALNTARREIRRLKRRRLYFWTDPNPEQLERVPATDNPKAKAALRQLGHLLDELSLEERLVYVLHVLEETPLLEVASVLDISRSTVKRRLKRAHERMLRRVEKNPLLTDYLFARSENPND